MQVESILINKPISDNQLSAKPETKWKGRKVRQQVGSDARITSKALSSSKTVPKEKIKKIFKPKTFEDITKFLYNDVSNHILLKICDRLDAHQKQAIQSISSKDMPTFYLYLTACIDSFKDCETKEEIEKQRDKVDSNIKTILYLIKRWPTIWEDFFEDIRQKTNRAEFISALKGEKNLSGLLIFLVKSAPEVYEGLPKDWDTVTSDRQFYDQIQCCLEKRRVIRQEVSEWFLSLDRLDSSVINQEEFPIHLLESDYRPTFEIWINLLSDEYFSASDSFIQRFLNFTKGNRELIAGVTCLLPRISEKVVWENILKLSENKGFHPPLQVLLTKKSYLRSPKSLTRLFSLSDDKLARLFSLFSANKESFPLLQLTSQLKGEVGDNILSWLQENSHLSRYVVDLMWKTHKNKNSFSFDFQKLIAWHKKCPEKATQILSVAFRYPSALRYLISQDLRDNESSLCETILNLFNPQIFLTECTHVLRLLETKENIPVVKDILAFGSNKKYASNLLDLAVASHVDLVTKMISRFKDKNMASDCLSHLLVAIGNSKNVTKIRQIFVLIENPPENEISASLLKAIRQDFVDSGELSEDTSFAVKAYLNGSRDSITFFLSKKAHTFTDPEKGFYIECFRTGNFELIEKCLSNPLHKIFNIYDVKNLEALFAVQKHLKELKYSIENIDYICKFMFVTLSDSPSHLGKALFLCFKSPVTLLKIVFSEKRKENLDQMVSLERFREQINKLFENNENRKATVLTADEVAKILLYNGLYNIWLANDLKNILEEFLPPYAFSHMNKKMKGLRTNVALRNILYRIPLKKGTSVLSALICPARQETFESCFATSLLMKLQNDSEEFLLCAIAMLQGKLKRTQDNVTIEFQLRVAPLTHFDNPHFLQTMELTIAQMSSSLIRNEAKDWLQNYLDRFSLPNDPMNQKAWHTFVDFFHKTYDQWSKWIFVYSEKNDQDMQGVWVLYDMIQKPGKQITTNDEFVILFKRALQFAMVQLQKTVQPTDGLRSILSKIEEEIHNGTFIKEIDRIASEMNPTFEDDKERLWKVVGGDVETVLATFYEKKYMVKENILGRKRDEEYLINEIFEICHTLPASMQDSYLVVGGEEHGFCLLPKKINQQKLFSKEARQEWICQRIQMAKEFVPNFPEATEEVLAADSPVRALIVEAALQTGGPLSERVSEIRDEINKNAFQKAFETQNARLACPFSDTNFYDEEGFAYYVAANVDVSEGTLICGDGKSVPTNYETADFEFTPGEHRDKYEIYFV